MTVRIKDVASLANVSSATVSRVLANKPYIRDEIRHRVLQAVETIGYQPNRVARTLRVQSSQIIGLIISDIQKETMVVLKNCTALFLVNDTTIKD